MPRRIWHDASGNFGIIDSGYPGALTAPTSYFNAVYLHPDLSYMKIVDEQEATLTLPTRSKSADGVCWYYDHSPFSGHGLGTIPYAVLLVNGVQIPAMGAIESDGVGDDWRFLTLWADSSGYAVRESWALKNSFPPKTVSLKLIAYDVAPANTHTKKFHFTPADGRLRAAYGKFDTNNKYLRKVDVGTPDFYMTAQRTIDAYSSGSTVCGLIQDLPGQTINAGYAGSFSTSGTFGVAD
jgi:hypothetical protein